MPAISNLTRPRPITVTVDLGDSDMLTVTFDRNKVTPNWVGTSQHLLNANDAHATSKMLAGVVMDWDVTEDDGSAFAPTVANLGRLSMATQGALLGAIVKGSVPGEAEGKASGVPPSMQPSDYEAPAPTPQNGQATSPSPEPLASPSPT